MREVTEGTPLDDVKQAEREWHESVYATHALSAFPDTAEEFANG